MNYKQYFIFEGSANPKHYINMLYVSSNHFNLIYKTNHKFNNQFQNSLLNVNNKNKKEKLIKNYIIRDIIKKLIIKILKI